MSAPKGWILYSGPSEIDGDPIVAILVLRSTNRKTGDMGQVYIIRSDLSPQEAVWTGQDASICGGCIHRGDGTGSGRTCYVNLGQGPRAVYQAFKAGRYLVAGDLTAVGAGRSIRLGAYGDPAAVPVWVWRLLLHRAASHTGYTHQWRSPRLRSALEFCQASVDAPEDVAALERVAPGAGYFRVLPVVGATDLPGETECLSESSGLTCLECGLCNGKGARITITAHGPAANRYTGKRATSRAT